ncbi:MAG: type II secretion system protein GspE, partial [Gammaproteobacteria bacterium]|nr:type II secretion system protein GspE [Gammaproteobacteria bacterium]
MSTPEAEIAHEDILTPQRLPYAFAKRHGVLISQIEQDQIKVLHRADMDPNILAEVRRVTGRAIELS